MNPIARGFYFKNIALELHRLPSAPLSRDNWVCITGGVPIIRSPVLSIGDMNYKVLYHNKFEI